MRVSEIAGQLKISPKKLERESIRTYLRLKVKDIEAEICRVGVKYGVKSVFELDKFIKKGKVHEEESFEDFFELDALATERKKLKTLLKKV